MTLNLCNEFPKGTDVILFALDTVSNKQFQYPEDIIHINLSILINASCIELLVIEEIFVLHNLETRNCNLLSL